jgi:hypothetical protein
MAFFFSRDTKVFMKWQEDTADSKNALYEIPVLDGFSFSQATNTSEITLSEAANSTGGSKRGRAMFTDSFAPAEWAFTTYMRPTVSGANAHYTNGDHADAGKIFAVEGPLWAAMSANTYDRACGGDFAGGTSQAFNFANSNYSTLGQFDMYFVLGAAKDTATATYATGTEGVTVYKLANCSVGTASIDFDIDGLAQIAWSGNGQTIEEVASLTTTAGGTTVSGVINEGVGFSNNYIRQKLTDLAIKYDASETTGDKTGTLGTDDVTYALTITGGNITIENNLAYLTPETLGQVNTPAGHVMGTRSVSGNFTCYLNDATNGSLDLFENIQEARGIITNVFDMTFSIGGSGNTPRCNVDVARAHLELPAHSLDDVISVDVNFHGLSTDLSAGDATAANEVAVTYTAA